MGSGRAISGKDSIAYGHHKASAFLQLSTPRIKYLVLFFFSISKRQVLISLKTIEITAF